MADLDKCYFTFWKMMEEGRVYDDRSVDFDTICRLTGALPDDLDVLLYEELGYTGEEILEAYRINCL